MATYKKRATKKAETAVQSESTTEEVFSTLYTRAGSAERWVAQNQQIILGTILGIIVVVLGFLAYLINSLTDKVVDTLTEVAKDVAANYQ